MHPNRWRAALLAAGTIVATSTVPGGPADDSSSGASINADGTQVAFASDARNLVPFDDNDSSDAFVVDLV